MWNVTRDASLIHFTKNAKKWLYGKFQSTGDFVAVSVLTSENCKVGNNNDLIYKILTRPAESVVQTDSCLIAIRKPLDICKSCPESTSCLCEMYLEPRPYV